MKRRIQALGVLMVVVVVILALAWIMGDTEQTRWIEMPVMAPDAKAGS